MVSTPEMDTRIAGEEVYGTVYAAAYDLACSVASRRKCRVTELPERRGASSHRRHFEIWDPELGRPVDVFQSGQLMGDTFYVRSTDVQVGGRLFTLNMLDGLVRDPILTEADEAKLAGDAFDSFARALLHADSEGNQ